MSPSAEWGPRGDRPKEVGLQGVANMAIYDDIDILNEVGGCEKRTEL